MKACNKIYNGLGVSAAFNELQENIDLFGEFDARKKSPIHAQMDDIWLRYGDISKLVKDGDYSTIADEHDSVWLKDLPECKRICFDVMALVEGERLGGVLITRLPPNGEILNHTDSGWHADYYDKYYVPIQNEDGAVFGFDDGELNPTLGGVWAFDNSKPHYVKNNTNSDRIAMVVCIKQGKYDRCGNLLSKG